MLIERLRSYCFPGGEERARLVRAVRTTQRGEIRGGSGARWLSFTAEEEIDATRSRFRWFARAGKVTVTDAYEEGRGSLVVKAAGLIPISRATGPDADRGELQRYLASVMFCPPMLLNNRALEWTETGPASLQVRDRNEPSATIDLELAEDGLPKVCRANRPRLVGKRAELTPWSGVGSEPREWEGLRVPTRLEVFWHLPEGSFCYFRADVLTLVLVAG